MMGMHAKLTAVAAATVFVLAGMAQATPITVANYSFEDPAGTSFAWGVNDWGNVNTFTFTPSDYYPMSAEDGVQAIGANGGGVSQLTDYVIAAGDVFTLKVAVGWTTVSSDGSTVYGVGLYIDNLVGSGVASQTGTVNALGSTGTWNDVTVTYTATNDDAGKKIGIWMNDGSPQALFDNVRLDVTAVPEPATMALLGLGGMGMLIRRKR